METYLDWYLKRKQSDITETTDISKLGAELLTEASSTSARYSIEVNFRTKIKEMLEGYAKICLGYVSAAMKQSGYHIKHVYDDKPIRILVSSRNWDDGEWSAIVYFHPDHDGGCFIIAKGFYNKEVKSISMQTKTKCKGNSAAEITAELRNIMHELKNKPDRHQEKIKGIALKRGPK